MPPAEAWLIRHGETEWSITGQHSGRHDLPLTSRGEQEAIELRTVLAGCEFARVLCSPLQRARRTCELAGFLDRAVIEPDMQEWDYGDCTSKTEADMRAEFPRWTLWDGPVPNGESTDEIAERARRIVEKVRENQGPVALFAHGHFLRVFTTQWLGLPAFAGRNFALETGSVCILGFDAGFPAVRKWNVRSLR